MTGSEPSAPRRCDPCAASAVVPPIRSGRPCEPRIVGAPLADVEASDACAGVARLAIPHLAENA